MPSERAHRVRQPTTPSHRLQFEAFQPRPVGRQEHQFTWLPAAYVVTVGWWCGEKLSQTTYNISTAWVGVALSLAGLAVAALSVIRVRRGGFSQN